MTNARRSRGSAATAAVDITAALRARIDQLEAALAERDREDKIRGHIVNILVDDTAAQRYGHAVETLAAMPEALAAALEYPTPDAVVRVPVCGRSVAVVLTGGQELGPVERAAVWERVEAIVEEAAGHPVEAIALIRTELPAGVAALAWKHDGRPAVVCSWQTRRIALRRALHAAGHDLVGGVR